MLRRFFIHFCLMLMFVLVQTGVVTHAISHLNEHNQENQLTQNEGSQDTNELAEHCGQCLAYAQADGVLPNDASLQLTDYAQFALTTLYQAQLATALSPSFSARAPPSHLKTLA